MAQRQRSGRHWLSRLVAGLTALVGTVAVVAGVPLLLMEVAGNPLPRHVPSFEEIGTLLTSPDNGSLFMRLLAVVAWLAWLTFSLSVLVEIPAQLRGRRAPRLPGLGFQQRLAAILVGAVIAVFAGVSVSTAAPPVPVVSVVSSGTPTFADPTVVSPPTHAPIYTAVYASVHAGAAHVAEPTQPQITRPVYVVRKHDYLGRIAQRFTGDFDRYRQIAALNPGLIRNPNHIQPGWRIVLPTDASDRGVTRHATGRLVTPSVKPPAPPTQAPPAPTPAPSTPAPSPSVAVTPSVAPSKAPPPSKAPATQAPVVQAPVAQAPTRAAQPDHSTTDSAADPGMQVLAASAGFAAFSVLAAHVVLRRRRTRRINQLRVKRRRNAPIYRHTTESEARQAAKHRAADRLDSGLRRLTIGLGGRAAWEMPDIAAAWQHGGDLAVILATPCEDPPSPFEVRSPNTWSLPATAHISESSPAPSLLPGLLSVGTWAQGGELFVDGERTGLISLVGNPQCCDDLLRFLAAEAATVSWADDTSVVVAGFSTADMGALAELNPRRVRVAVSVDDAIARIAKRAAINSAMLRDARTTDTIAARVNNITDTAWSTHLLFIADAWGEYSRQLQSLDAQLAALGRVGVVVVATQPSPTRWSAQISADGSLEMAWLAVTGTTACQLSSDQLIEQAEAIRYARDSEPSEVGPRHRLRV
ncbi:LysM repeat protein [Allocatelliglobosispora scoriae]|uniref:LysM repeat protein n=1 Tax=Allocatelliglobosispora scoriae TaxID=643052 RepID=A0A841BPK5_9ACTN|nr:LysM domain-containing protein [Allocatelliglobosispora scoriae]MBB5869615.1 LysM repeat protein [Allocatelliglobosispora scoriae]